MSDAPKVCERELKRYFEISGPELSYAARNVERKPPIALNIPYPLLREWHKYLSSGHAGTRTPLVQNENAHNYVNQIVDYVYLLEAAIPTSLFAFTDNKEKMDEIK